MLAPGPALSSVSPPTRPSVVCASSLDSGPRDVLVHARDTDAVLLGEPDETIVAPSRVPGILHDPDVVTRRQVVSPAAAAGVAFTSLSLTTGAAA